ncbi:MAG TPA: hypothetical protein VGJ75_13905, partial [Dongiaceae bacterium]
MSEFSINLPPRLPTAGPAPNVLTAVVPDAPRQLAQLDSGTIIKGQVQGRDPDGLLVIVTDKGALKLSTPANLPTGSQVTLEIRNAGDRLQVLVLSVDGQPASSASGQGPRTGPVPPATTPSGGQTQAPPPSTGTAQPAPVAIVGSQLQGTIVQAAPDTLSQLIRSLLPGPPAAQPAVPGAPVLLPGAQLPLPAPGPAPVPAAPTGTAPNAPSQGTGEALPKALVTSLQADVRAKIESLFFSAAPAKGGAAPALPTSSPGTFISGAPSSPQGPSQAFAQGMKLPIPLTTGSEVRLRLIAIASGPGLPLAIPASAAGVPHVMAGRIIGYTPAGNAVLHSPLGAIILQGVLSLPLGA